MIGKIIRYSLKDFRNMALAQGGIFVVSTIIFIIIMNVGDADSTFELATGIMLFGVLALDLFAMCFGLQGEFNLMIGMGVTRREFLIGHYITYLFTVAFQMGLVYLSHFVEAAEIRIFYSGIEKETGVEPFLFSWYVIPVMLAVVVLTTFFGFWFMRAGKAVWIGIWGVWMVACMLPGRVEKAMEKGDPSALNSFGHWFLDTASGITPLMAGIAFTVVTVAALIATVLMVKKQRVTA